MNNVPTAADRKIIDRMINNCRNKNHIIVREYRFEPFFNAVVKLYASGQCLTREEIVELSKMTFYGLRDNRLIHLVKLLNNFTLAQNMLRYSGMRLYIINEFYKNPYDFQLMTLFISNTLSNASNWGYNILDITKIEHTYKNKITIEQLKQYAESANPNVILIEKILRDTGFRLDDGYKYYVAEHGRLKNFQFITQDFDDRCLEAACKSNNNMSHANKMCHSRNEDDDIQKMEFLLDRKLKPTVQCFHNIVANHKDSKIRCCGKIDLLLNYGYIPTYTDILSALEHRIIIKNIERYGFKFDDEYAKICCRINETPYGDIVPTHDCLLEACKVNRNIQMIRKLLNVVKPNTQCLQEACCHANNYKVIDLLIKHGVELDTKCIENLAHANCDARFNALFDRYRSKN